MRTQPPWESAYPGNGQRDAQQEQRPGCSGAGGGECGGEGGHTDGADVAAANSGVGRSTKRRRGRPSNEDVQDGGGATTKTPTLPADKSSPSCPVTALPVVSMMGGQGGARSILAGMPQPRELDYGRDLSSGGFALKVGRYNSRVFATRCEQW